MLIVGLGSIGRRHAANLRALGVEALLGYDPVANGVFLDGVRRCRSLEEGLSWRPDVVFVTVPTYLHVPIALAAAEQGAHLFIEKPLAHTTDGLAELEAAVRARRLVNMVGCNMRFHGGPSRIKALLEDGAIGPVTAARIQTGSYLPLWRPGTDYHASYSARAEQGGGAVLDCIHELDLALWYFGPGRVIGAAVVPARTLDLEVEGLAEVLILHDSGVLSSVHMNFVQRDYRRGCQLVGDQGTLYWDYEDAWISIRRERPPAVTIPLRAEETSNDAYVEEVKYFLCCVRDSVQTMNSVERAAETLSVALDAKALAGATMRGRV